MEISEERLEAWNATLASSNFFGGDDPSEEDNANWMTLVGAEPPTRFSNLYGWFLTVGCFTEEVRTSWPPSKKSNNEKKEGHGEETKVHSDSKESNSHKNEEEKEEIKKEENRTDKTFIQFAVKPLEADQDLDKIAQKILTIEIDGLEWSEYKITSYKTF